MRVRQGVLRYNHIILLYLAEPIFAPNPMQMKVLKGLLDLVAFAYIIFTLLLLAGVVDADTLLNSTAEDRVLTLYQIIVAAAGVILLARILVSNLYIADLKHDRHRAELKINELKASLYEKRQAFRSNSYQEAPAEAEDLN